MKQKIHMQDQVTNRIEIIMQEKSSGITQFIEEVLTFGFVVILLALVII